MTAASQSSAGRAATGPGRGSPDLESARPAEHLYCTCVHSRTLHNLATKGRGRIARSSDRVACPAAAAGTSKKETATMGKAADRRLPVRGNRRL